MPEYDTALYERTARALDANQLRYSSFPEDGSFRMNFSVRSCLRQIIMLMYVHKTYDRFTARPVIKADIADEKALQEMSMLLANANFLLTQTSFGLDLHDGEIICSMSIRNNVQDMAEAISFCIDATIDAYSMFGRGILNVILSGASGKEEYLSCVENYDEEMSASEDDTEDTDGLDSGADALADTAELPDFASLFGEDESADDDDDELDEDDFRLSLFDE